MANESQPAGGTLPSDSSSTSEGRDGLSSVSFLGLLVTQFLGATNDNVFRWLAVGVGTHYLSQGEGKADPSIALSAGLACMVAPFILFAAPAGYLADRYSKRSVIVWAKVAEIACMLLGVVAIFVGNVPFLFFVVFLMGAQSAFFGPSKLGSIPEMLRPDRIPVANGWIGLTTVIATVVGMGVGNFLYEMTKPAGQHLLWVSGSVIVGISIVGFLTSLLIRPLAVANPNRRFPWNPIPQTFRDLACLAASRPLLRVALGMVFFWSVGALAQSNIYDFVLEGGLKSTNATPLLGALVFGVGVGSVLAGYWSGGRVELGILPLGAAGIMASSLLMFTVKGPLAESDHALSGSFYWACGWLFLLGAGAGLFEIPLSSYMQHRSPREHRGAILAASNQLTFSGMIVSALAFWVLRHPIGSSGEPLMTARQVFLLCGVLTVPVFLYIVWLLPYASLRFLVWLASRTIYRVRVYGRHHLPETGGALLVVNHVTWLDGIMLLLTSSRPIRTLLYADYIQPGWRERLAKFGGAIAIKSSRPRAIVEAIQTARAALRDGELVCIFPEGALSRTGQLQEFKPGLMKIVEGTNAPVIPVYLDELWGSIFSFSEGKYFWKWPKRWPYPISILFGRPIPDPDNVHTVRRAVEELGAEAMDLRKTRRMNPPHQFLRMAKRNLWREKVADSLKTSLTGGRLLSAALAFRRLLARELPDDKYVGVVLPPMAGAVLANAVLALMNRVAVNLNYTATSEVNNACLRLCGIRRVLTSRRVMERLKLELDAELIYLEDLKQKVTRLDKLLGAVGAYAVPSAILDRLLGLVNVKPDDVLTIIFTSGSTGEPKGVMLTHANVGSNIEAIDQVFHLKPADVALGVLPFFHSFGYTGTLWTVLALAPKGVYHTNPLDAREIGKLCKEHGVTLLMATPTFLRGYMRRCEPDDFARLEVVVAGAEKLPVDVAAAFEEKFKVRPVEGYGTTELSPLVSVNIPESRAKSADHPVLKEGSVGRPIPGVAAKIVDTEDYSRELGFNESGMLLIRGPNVMKGYFNRPDLTAKVMLDGWYITGDMAQIDPAGFITITGRLSRFSKIGGEMVPHLRIEEELERLLGLAGDELKLAVTGVPDEKKGERLVVLYTDPELSPREACRGLSESGIPNLWIPTQDSFHLVDSIPILGSGKLDLRAVREVALAKESEGVKSVEN
jgi:acyl-[acyl-carrier-protein]-phospholipid O-acyltransferase/long-chain-fatty-acid--[acyl-carrier-protein] ligase